MKIQLIRHATILLNINNKRILVDPVLGSKGIMPAIPDVPNRRNNPLVSLPIDPKILIQVDAVLLTHIHGDHFDETAMNLLCKHIPVFCQPEDKTTIQNKGFHCVNAIEQFYKWEGITFNRTGGRHGNYIIAKKLGPVSGYVITAENEASLYITGDTVWCSKVEQALKFYEPEIIIAYAGCAQFKYGGPITMTKRDIQHIRKKSPYSRIIVTHMEAWNHCTLTRDKLKEFLVKNRLSEQVFIPNDGETIEI